LKYFNKEKILELERKIKELSASTNKVNLGMVHKMEVDIENFIVILGRTNSLRSKLLKQFKETLLNIFLKQDLDLISKAMSGTKDSKEIDHISINEELILKTNINNEVQVYLKKRGVNEFYRTIECGKYTFIRFVNLIYERYIPLEGFKPENN
jgi:hypothetical protein